MDHKPPFLLAALAILMLSPCVTAAAENPAGLQGHYRVRGECAEQLEDGSYRECVAWNTLTLARRPDGRFDYSLATSTFATTQGGCDSSGILSLGRSGRDEILYGTDAQDATCRISLRIAPKRIELIEPSQDELGCKSICAYNSSLYTDPFPRSSKRMVSHDS